MHETKNFLFTLGFLCLLFGQTQVTNAQCGFNIIEKDSSSITCSADMDGSIFVLVELTTSLQAFAYLNPPGNPPVLPMSDTIIGGNNFLFETFENLSAGTYEVIIVDETGCDDTISVVVDAPNTPFDVSFVDSLTRNADCGNNGFLEVDASGGWLPNPNVFTWDAYDEMGVQIVGYPRTQGFQLSLLSAGDYTVFAYDEKGCKDSAMITLTGGTPFEVDISVLNGSLPLALGDSIDLVATPNTPSPNIVYSWFPLKDLTTISVDKDSVRVQPCEDRTYIVLAVDEDRQCSDVDSINIVLEGEFLPWLPNIFNPSSPNPNNNEFQVFGIGIEEVAMQIFDRKGAIIYENPDSVLIGTWNGTLGNSGITAVAGKYLYVTRIKSICGEILSKTGGITLLR